MSKPATVARLCTYPDCPGEYRAGGLCTGHYAQRARGEELRPIRRLGRRPLPCIVDGCPNLGGLTGLCRWHHRCDVDGCDAQVKARGLCTTHYKHLREGKPLTKARSYQPTGSPCKTCGQPSYSRGLCEPHYRQATRSKAPRKTKAPKPEPDKPASNLPAGWFKPSLKPERPPTSTEENVSMFWLNTPDPETDPDKLDAFVGYLNRRGDFDILAKLGLAS